MINRIDIKNFQSHVDTHLEFSPNVNVIMGTSNSGKSAIIRAMRWCLTNQPKGFGFRRHNLKPKVVTSAAVLLDNGAYVTRQRSATSTNEFVVTKDIADVKLEALRGAVPEEVLTVTNISTLNIQSQFSPYFLIADTAGEVARTINEYTGLEIIDKVLKTANGAVSSATMHVTTLAEQLETQTKEAKALEYILKFKKPMARLERNIQTYQEKEEDLENINTLLSEIDVAEAELHTLQQIVTLKKDVIAIETSIKTYNAKQEQRVDLIESVNAVTNSRVRLATAQQKVDLLPDVLQLTQDAKTFKEKQDTKYGLQGHIIEWENLHADIDATTDILNLKDSVQSTLRDLYLIEADQTKIEQLMEISIEIRKCEESLILKEKMIGEIKEKLSEVEVCPLCHQQLERSLA